MHILEQGKIKVGPPAYLCHCHCGFRGTVYEEYIHEVRVGGKYCRPGQKKIFKCVCKVSIKNIYRVLSVMPELPSLDLLLLRLSVAEHEHDHRLHRWRLELPVVGVRLVVEGDPIELALVHVRHLVVLSSHAAGGRGIEGVVEAKRGEDLGYLHLLRVRVSTPVVVPGLSNRVLIEDVLGGVRFLGELEAGVTVDHASGGGDLHKSCQCGESGAYAACTDCITCISAP